MLRVVQLKTSWKYLRFLEATKDEQVRSKIRGIPFCVNQSLLKAACAFRETHQVGPFVEGFSENTRCVVSHEIIHIL